MKFEIKNKFTGAVQFTAEIEADENTSTSLKIGLAVKWAIKSRANLSGADLSGAYLSRADLSGADLSGANGEKITIEKTPIQILTEVYDIIIFDEHMKIGCEFHSLAEWWAFKDSQIAEMDRTRARKFWKAWKALLKAICKANGRK